MHATSKTTTSTFFLRVQNLFNLRYAAHVQKLVHIYAKLHFKNYEENYLSNLREYFILQIKRVVINKINVPNSINCLSLYRYCKKVHKNNVLDLILLLCAFLKWISIESSSTYKLLSEYMQFKREFQNLK